MLLEIGVTPMSTRDIIFWIIFIPSMVLLYQLRNKNETFKAIWKIVSTFFIVLFAILFANYAKKEIKNWWNKD